MSTDLNVILGAVIGALVRSGETPGEIRVQVEAALATAEALKLTCTWPGCHETHEYRATT